MADITTGSSTSAVSARPELSIYDGIVTTTSLQVSQFFGKRHDNVLRAIRALIRETAAVEYRLNFEGFEANSPYLNKTMSLELVTDKSKFTNTFPTGTKDACAN